MAGTVTLGPLLAERTLKIIRLIHPKRERSLLFGNTNVEDPKPAIRDFRTKTVLSGCNQNRISVDRDYTKAFVKLIGSIGSVVKSYIVDEIGRHLCLLLRGGGYSKNSFSPAITECFLNLASLWSGKSVR